MKYFASKDFYSAISGVSTNYNSQLDYAFYRGVYPTVHFYESYFSDHKAILINLSCLNKNLRGSCLDKIVSSSNGDSDDNSVCIHKTRQDVIIDRVNIPPPVPTITVSGNTSRTLTDAMRRALADSISL